MTPEQFFHYYHDRVYNKTLSISEALEELREAWKVYPSSRKRIEDMANVLKIGMKKRPEVVPELTVLEQNVMETML